MDLIDLCLRYLNQIIIIVQEVQVIWHKCIYIYIYIYIWALISFKNPNLFPLKLHVYIYKKFPFVSTTTHD